VKLVVALFLVFAACSSHADLAVICTDASAKTPIACTQLKYDSPKPTDLVRRGSNWDNFTLVPFASLASTDLVDVCKDPIPAGTPTTLPYVAATDPCKNFGSVAASKLGDVLPSLRVTWTQDLKNTDGTALADLAGFRLVYGTDPTALNQTIEVKNPAARELVLTNLAYGTKYYVALKAFTAGGRESDKSNTDFGTTPAKPSAPTNPVPPVLKVTELTAYDLVKSNDKLAVAAIGTVPASTKCNSAVTAMGLFGVPRSSVTLAKGVTTRPQVVLAKCA
jgi:hypothetical protein